MLEFSVHTVNITCNRNIDKIEYGSQVPQVPQVRYPSTPTYDFYNFLFAYQILAIIMKIV